ncbi:MAG: hypothetical protein QOJ27_2056 [Sphingomonadales bacterium]|jgi:hypothetical protein|nr:hypothetical protein [Sphingomonadales bacterium]
MDESLRLPPRLAAILEDLPLEELVFTPVPVKPRRDGWSPARQLAFILRLALLGGVASAAKAVGMSRESAYRLREHPAAAGFAAAWDKAQGWGRGRAADLAADRAVNGEKRDVFYRGRKVGEYVRHDNRLLIAALNRLPPPAAADPDPAGTLRRLLDEIDPGGAEPPRESNDFPPRFA